MTDKNHLGPKVIRFPNSRQSPVVEIVPHPDDVIDVDPQIIAVMKARLAGEPLEQFFSRDDQMTNELAIERERQKLRTVFPDAAAVYGGFASLEAVKVTRTRLRELGVDRELLSVYATRKSVGQTIDEADLYAHLIGGGELQAKHVRVEALMKLKPTLGPKARQVVEGVGEHYLADAFGTFGVSKEMIDLSPVLREQFKSGEIQGAVDEVLSVLYGRTE